MKEIKHLIRAIAAKSNPAAGIFSPKEVEEEIKGLFVKGFTLFSTEKVGTEGKGGDAATIILYILVKE